MKKVLSAPFHPLLIGTYTTVFLYAHNRYALELQELTTPLILTMFLSFSTWAVLTFFTLERKVSAIVASLLLFLSFAYSPIVRIAPFISPLKIYMLVSVVAIFSVLMLIRKWPKNLSVVTIFLNVTALFLITIPVIDIVQIFIERSSRNTQISKLVNSVNRETNQNEGRDIYYIMVDSYASRNSLKNYYNYDNSEFLAFLEEKGFYIADESYSNYPHTVPSLASSINFDYLDSLAQKVGKTSRDETPQLELIQENQLVKYLKEHNYKFYNYGTVLLDGEVSPYADYNFDYSTVTSGLKLSNLETLILSDTVAKPFFNSLIAESKPGFLNERYQHYFTNLRVISDATKKITEPGPKFVFVHSLLTHVPYVYDKDGNFKSASLEKATSWQENYRDQLIFTNKLLVNYINSILSESKKPPIIILQSDEGPYFERSRAEDNQFDWKSATADELKEKMGILNAYYLPGVKMEDVLYQQISPVNSFRVVLNIYFKEKLPLLPDKYYVRSRRYLPYDLHEVTELVAKQ